MGNLLGWVVAFLVLAIGVALESGGIAGFAMEVAGLLL